MRQTICPVKVTREYISAPGVAVGVIVGICVGGRVGEGVWVGLGGRGVAVAAGTGVGDGAGVAHPAASKAISEKRMTSFFIVNTPSRELLVSNS
jgi:hypothetical protein